jgi:hypothetical protein
MDKQEAIKQAELIKAELAKLQAIIEAPDSKVWTPELCARYYVIYNGKIAFSMWDNDGTDKRRFALNNVFKTKEEAEFALEKRLVIAELERLAMENPVIWSNSSDSKSYMYYSIGDNVLKVDSLNTMQVQGAIFFASKALCLEAVEKVGEARIKKYLFNIK